jgi:ADP-ribosyl-[dinitrogen reductase] hydrolase
MGGFGSHDQPPGTWSDDGALTLCTVDSLLHAEFDTADMGRRFLQWMREGLWTATGAPFDIGSGTLAALRRIGGGTRAEEAGGRDEECNGNGSLMRILPVALRFAREPAARRRERLSRASCITHAHERSQLACVLYGYVVRYLLEGGTPQAALASAATEFSTACGCSVEYSHFRRVLHDDLAQWQEDEVASSGYVMHTLQASLWCLLTTRHFEECVLKAVNLGGDTDTTGCVAGGLAGVHYGLEQVPHSWRSALARRDEVEALFDRFAAVVVAQP